MRWAVSGAGVLVVALATACGTPGSDGDEVGPMDGIDAASVITVTSSAFDEGGKVPSRFTCDGEDLSPPLAWSSVPADAAALALVVDDPDAPSGTFTHWVVLDLPPGTASLEEDAEPPGPQARNSAGKAAWMGPCPPRGTHRYRFTVVALRAQTGLTAGADLGEALDAVRDAAIAQGRLTATYARSG